MDDFKFAQDFHGVSHQNFQPERPCGGRSWRAPSDASETWNHPSVGEAVDCHVSNLYIHTYIHTKHTYKHTYIHTYIHTYMQKNIYIVAP